MPDKNKVSEEIFNDLNPSLHKYFDLAANELDIPQPLHDAIATNEKRYQQGMLIDQGGMKKILKIEDALTGRPVAMATLINPDDSSKVERFFREARITAALEHPNIIPVYDIGLTEKDDPFFTMKLINGNNLSSLLKKQNGEYSLQFLLDIFIKVCDAISYSHSKGILHLDLKPSNIQIGNYGEVLVCDWGLAKVIDSPEETIDGELEPCLYNDITLDGIIKGTPGFMAPEQVDNKLGVKDKRTDIYALGGILYTLLTNRPPVENDSVQDVLNETVKGNIRPPSSLDLKKNIPPSLEAVVMKALETDPEERYQKVADLRQDILNWLGGFATSAENAGFMKSAQLLFKRHKTVSGLLFFILISLILSTITITHKGRLASEALALYEEEKRQTEILGREDSERLVFQAVQSLHTYQFDEALEFSEQATELNPENFLAHATKGVIHTYRQEFNAALKSFELSKDFKQNYSRYLKTAKRYKKYKNDDELLPAKQLIDLVKSFPEPKSLYRFYRYNLLKYKSLEEHVKVCFYVLRHNNPKVKNLKHILNYHEQGLDMDISGNPLLTNSNCIRDIPIQRLNISNTGIWQTRQLTNMPITEIKMMNTKIKSLKDIFKIKTLKRIYIQKNEFPGARPPQGRDIEIIRL